MDDARRAAMARDAQQHLQAAIACLDALEWHQCAAHADLALHLLDSERRRQLPATGPG